MFRTFFSKGVWKAGIILQTW